MRTIRSSDPSRVLALSDSHASETGNLKLVGNAAAARGYRVTYLLKGGLHKRRSLRDSVRLCWHIAGAGTILLDDFYPLIYPLKLSTRTRVVQLWHASGAFKRVGFSRAGLPGGPSPDSISHSNYTDAIVSSEAIRPDYAEAFKLPVSRVHATGMPKTDKFFDTGRIAETRRKVRAALGISENQRLALFVPTFRGNGQLSAHYGPELLDWEKFSSVLPADMVVAVRLHPFVAARTGVPAEIGKLPNLRDANSGWHVDDLMMAADVLATDYSSAIFDFCLLDRPMVFYTPDLAEYTSSRDFYAPFSEYLVGPTTKTATEFAKALDGSTNSGVDYTEFKEKFCSANDGNATERVLNELIVADFDNWRNPR